MDIPPSVQQWLRLRKEYEQDPLFGPRVLPIVKIGNAWYFEDSRLGEFRRVDAPDERIAM
jgi:hypothetical protein